MFAVYAKEANFENSLASVVVGERPDPVIHEGWVRVKMTHVSLNRLDVFTLRGHSAQQAPIPFPLIMGNDGAGLLDDGKPASFTQSWERKTGKATKRSILRGTFSVSWCPARWPTMSPYPSAMRFPCPMASPPSMRLYSARPG